MFLTYHSHR